MPRLSANGHKVAFIASAPLVSRLAGSAAAQTDSNDDVYVVDMTASRRARRRCDS